MATRLPRFAPATVLLGWCAALSAPTVTDTAFQAQYDNSAQSYVIMLPDGFRLANPYDVVIILHGHGSGRWQCINADTTGMWTEFRATETVALQRGMIYVSPDYRCCTSWMGPAAEADVVQLIGILKSKYRVSRVFIAGASMGGASALEFTLLHPELVQGMASMNGTANFVEYANFQDAIAASFGGTKAQLPQVYRDRSAEFFPGRFTMPVAFTADSADGTVPPQSVWRLVDSLKALGKQDVLLLARRLGHVTSFSDAKRVLEYVIDQAAQTPVADRAPARPANTSCAPGTSGAESALVVRDLSGRLVLSRAGRLSAGAYVLGLESRRGVARGLAFVVR
jgi:dipeptidyl aminopeptidase/acylaminoacyl peptidase